MLLKVDSNVLNSFANAGSANNFARLVGRKSFSTQSAVASYRTACTVEAQMTTKLGKNATLAVDRSHCEVVLASREHRMCHIM